MRLGYKFGLATIASIAAYILIYGAILGSSPLIMFVLVVVVVGSGIPAMLATSWLFDRLATPRIRAALAPLRLAFFDSNEPTIRALRQALAGHPQFTALVAKPGQLTQQQRGLDALYVPLSEVAERWGAHPASSKSQVLRTRPEDSGMPPFVVAGPLIPADDPSRELKLTLAAVLDAVKAFNAHSSYPIRVVGFWTSTLGIGRMDPAEAAKTIISVYEEKLGESSTGQPET
jgi:hypothetical protein